MLRKLALLAAVPIVLAACNSITGTQQANTPSDKVCLDDWRAVRITHPTVLPVCSGTCLVTWEVLNVCAAYDAELHVSLDNGLTWQTCGGATNICSKPWTISEECVGKTALVKVIIRDSIGELVDVNQVQIVQTRAPRHPDQVRD